MSNGNISGIDDALSFCEERLKFHQQRSQFHFMFSMTSLILGATVIFMGHVTLFGEESTTSVLTVSAFSVVAFGVLMALHRYHLTEISKYEHYKLAFARLNIAQSFNESATEHVISSLTIDAFNFKGGSGGSVQSPIPGHPGSDLSALLVSKLLDNARANNSANKKKQADA